MASYVPTARFWKLAAAGLLIAVAGIAVPGFERLLVPYNLALVSAAVLSAIAAPKPSRLRVVRKFENVLSNRTSNRIELEVENDTRTGYRGRLVDGAPDSFARDRIEIPFSVDSGRSKTVAYHVTPRARGRDFFSGTYLRVLAPLGLVEVEDVANNRQPVRIYPNVLALREFDLLNQKGRLNLIGIRKSRLRGRGTEFESLRDYQDDEFRRIDWKSTAKRGKLVVRDYETERNQPVLVCLDIGRSMMPDVGDAGKLDHVLDACLMLLHAAQAAGDQTGVLAYSDQVKRFVPPRKGKSQAGAIIEDVHALQSEPVETDSPKAFGFLAARWKRRSLIVVFTDFEGVEEAQRLSVALAPLRRQHIVLVVRVCDPMLEQATKMPIKETADMYRRAASVWLKQDRARAAAVLTQTGIRHLEAEPDALSRALVSAYLKIKETAQL